MSQDRPLAIQKPKSIWTRRVKFDLKPMFKALGKTATHAATLKVEEFGNDAVDLATSLGLESPIEEIAYTLIRNAASRGLTALTRESLNHIDPLLISDENLSASLTASLDGSEISLSGDFFDAPENAPFVQNIARDYSQWLCDRGVSPKNSDTIAKRFPSYYVFALAEEWRKGPQAYSRLLDAESTPFAKAESELRGWGHYFAHLKRRLAENVFDEPFSLEQIYIPLNAYFVERQERGRSEFRGQERKVCVRLHHELREWLIANRPNDRLRVISGGPGSGKSSFARIFCDEVAEEGIARPLFVPLHVIDPTRDINSEIERFVKDEGFLGFNPLDSERGDDKLLLVFDGLDELASMGKAAAQVARDFVHAVERMIERRSIGTTPIRVLISGRELVIQENKTEFRGSRQVLNLLPYFNTDSNANYLDEESLLDVDLRETWWKNYGSLTGEGFSGLPSQLKMDEIDEITSQPLLNYLVALSFRRGELDFTKKLNLNNVYHDLVVAVHQRGYERSRTYQSIRHISEADFIRVLEEIGLAAWHGSDGRSTSVGDIMSHCKQSGLESLLLTFKEGAEAGVTKLLAAFFFRRSGESVGNDATFVFTHKSFGEYLTAVRLRRGLDRIVIERRRRKANADDGLDINDAWLQWLRLAGPAPVTEYILTFLRREISDVPHAELLEWQEILSELASAAVNDSIPIERLANSTFAEATRYYIYASTAMFLALNSVSVTLGMLSKVEFSSKASFGTFLRRVCPQRTGPQSPVLFSALSNLDLSGQCLDMVDLYGANLSNTRWKGAELHFSTLSGADLTDADFSDATLNWAKVDGAVLNRTIFVRTRMHEVRFSSIGGWKTSMNGVNFSQADMRGAIFTGSEVVSCDFRGALLTTSSLHKTSVISHCNLDGAMVADSDKSLIQWQRRHHKVGDIIGSLEVKEAQALQEVWAAMRHQAIDAARRSGSGEGEHS